jgi:hypothetical protein
MRGDLVFEIKGKRSEVERKVKAQIPFSTSLEDLGEKVILTITDPPVKNEDSLMNFLQDVYGTNNVSRVQSV